MNINSKKSIDERKPKFCKEGEKRMGRGLLLIKYSVFIHLSVLWQDKVKGTKWSKDCKNHYMSI